MLSARSISTARTIWRSLASKRALARAAPAGAPPAWSGSSRRRRCGRCVTNCSAARAQRQRIDAVMRAEALVLVGEQHVEEARIDIVDRRRQPPAAFARSHRPQQPAVAVDHQRSRTRDPRRAAPGRARRSTSAAAAGKQPRRRRRSKRSDATRPSSPSPAQGRDRRGRQLPASPADARSPGIERTAAALSASLISPP